MIRSSTGDSWRLHDFVIESDRLHNQDSLHCAHAPDVHVPAVHRDPVTSGARVGLECDRPPARCADRVERDDAGRAAAGDGAARGRPERCMPRRTDAGRRASARRAPTRVLHGREHVGRHRAPWRERHAPLHPVQQARVALHQLLLAGRLRCHRHRSPDRPSGSHAPHQQRRRAAPAAEGVRGLRNAPMRHHDRRARYRARVDSAPGRRHAPAAAYGRAHHIAAQRAEGRSGREPVRAPDRATIAQASRLLGQHRRSLGAEAR